MRAIAEVPTPECKIQLYLTLQDISKLQSLRETMINRTGKYFREKLFDSQQYYEVAWRFMWRTAMGVKE